MVDPSIRKLGRDFPGCASLVGGEDPRDRPNNTVSRPVPLHKEEGSYEAGRAPVEGLCLRRKGGFLTASSLEQAEDIRP